MFHLFQFEKEQYLRHFHKRSNVESVFSAIKRVFGESVLSRTETAMKHRSMRTGAAAPMPFFHTAGKAFADRAALDVEQIAGLKNISLEFLAEFRIFLRR